MAYQLEGYQWPDGTNHFDVCIKNDPNDRGFGDFRKDNIAQWVETMAIPGWAHRPDISFNINFTTQCGGTQLEIVIEKAPGSEFADPVAMRTGTTLQGVWPFQTVKKKVIQVNDEFDDYFWWNTGVQSCYVKVGAGCDADARTMIRHEVGHALGVYHTTDNDDLCVSGYYSTSDEGACLPAGQKTMSPDAGVEFPVGIEGYRHDIRQDDVDALIAIYGDCYYISGCF